MKLEFDGIQFGYEDKPLLSSVYMQCETGKVTGLLGRNGSGKSTLLKIVFGSVRPEVSSVRINSHRIPSPAFASRAIAYLPQDKFLPTDISVRDILRLYKIEEDKIIGSFPELKEDIGLRADELSGGQLRLFEVLLILFSRAMFVLLDEPFTGLSPAVIERLHVVIHREKTEKGILITDHLHRHVTSLADQLYLLVEGKTHLIREEEELIRRGYVAALE